MANTREAPAINWCFTLNNYTEEEYQTLIETDCQYQIIGKEVGEQGTPHLQGYIQFKQKKRITGLKKINSRAHWEKARGSPDQNQKYCSKEGNYKEIGTLSVQGKKKLNMELAVKQLLQGVGAEELFETHGAGYIMHKRKLQDMASDIREEQEIKRQRSKMEKVELRDWQVKALEKLDKQNDRQILFIVDIQGGKGKTFFSRWLISMRNTIRFDNGRSADIKHGFDGQQYVLFDMVRSSQDHINYEAIEAIKNGVVYSTKYNSKMKNKDPPKVAVFMNKFPDKKMLSDDRYDIMDISTYPLEKINHN